MEQLHSIFGGSDKHNNKVEEILGISDFNIAYAKAYEYYTWGKNGQANCRSDFSYWMYAGDIALAKVLCAIILFLKRGQTEFPTLDYDEGRVLMDKQAMLEEWAHNLISNHQHEYVGVSLNHGEKNEDYPDGCPYAGIFYYRCKTCGDKKYSWEPPKP